MIFEPMKHSDLETIECLESQCFKEPWNKEDCRRELDENPFSNGWILKEENQIVAYAFLWETFEMAQLARIGVDPAFRKRGIAKAMMNHLNERAKSANCEFMTLEVRQSNEAAIHLYESCQFIQVNVSKGYYSDGEDALVMTKAL